MVKKTISTRSFAFGELIRQARTMNIVEDACKPTSPSSEYVPVSCGPALILIRIEKGDK